jgi:hypothetical protein
LFNVNRSNSILTDFLDNFIFWLMDARNAKSTCENVGWVVHSGPNSSWFGDTKKYEAQTVTATSGSKHNQSGGGDRDKKRKLISPSSAITSTVDQTSVCHVCNRLKHPDNKCPFYTWHPYANKEANTAFSDSSKGKQDIGDTLNCLNTLTPRVWMV